MALISVYGSAAEPSPNLVRMARDLGVALAERGHEVLTGACPGVSYAVARAAWEQGATVVGYSPATSLAEHQRNGDPTEGLTQIIFLPEGYEFRHHLHACYKYRNIRTAMACDAAVIIHGGMGTLNEFTLVCDFGKVVGVLETSGGTADVIRSIAARIGRTESSARVVYGSSPMNLLEQVESCLAERQQ